MRRGDWFRTAVLFAHGGYGVWRNRRTGWTVRPEIGEDNRANARRYGYAVIGPDGVIEHSDYPLQDARDWADRKAGSAT
jgi:hypothetical protein